MWGLQTACIYGSFDVSSFWNCWHMSAHSRRYKVPPQCFLEFRLECVFKQQVLFGVTCTATSNNMVARHLKHLLREVSDSDVSWQPQDIPENITEGISLLPQSHLEGGVTELIEFGNTDFLGPHLLYLLLFVFIMDVHSRIISNRQMAT